MWSKMKYIDLSVFKVSYEYVPSPDAEERLNRAFGMIFDKIEKEKLVRRRIYQTKA